MLLLLIFSPIQLYAYYRPCHISMSVPFTIVDFNTVDYFMFYKLYHQEGKFEDI